MKKYNKFDLEKIKSTPADKLIHVRLDAKTRITISKMSQLEAWKVRYPNAVVVAS